jgi:hypothetical protein
MSTQQAGCAVFSLVRTGSVWFTCETELGVVSRTSIYGTCRREPEAVVVAAVAAGFYWTIYLVCKPATYALRRSTALHCDGLGHISLQCTASAVRCPLCSAVRCSAVQCSAPPQHDQRLNTPSGCQCTLGSDRQPLEHCSRPSLRCHQPLVHGSSVALGAAQADLHCALILCCSFCTFCNPAQGGMCPFGPSPV